MRFRPTILLPRAIRTALVMLLLAAAGSLVPPAAAQPAAERDSLRQQVERRFDVLPLRDGVALKPHAPAHGVRSIELTGDTIAVDGAPVTGGELRERLGTADADLVLRLSYLDAAARRALFIREPPSPPAAPAPEAAPAAPEPPAPPSPPVRRSRRGRQSDARIRFGGDLTVRADEVVSDDVVVIGGSARIDGRVQGDVVAVGGSVYLGPAADVSGDVAVIGGELHRDPGAQVAGRVHEVATGAIRINGASWRALPFLWGGTLFGGAFALMSTLTRFAVLCLAVCLVVLLGRNHVERVSARAAAEPVKAGAVGLLAELLLLPLLVITIVALVITIIGIPLLVLIPFALLAVAVLFLVGFTGVASWVGAAASARMGWPRDNVYVTTIIGVALLISPILVARLLGLAGGLLFPFTGALLAVGLLVEYIAWTVGFGAVALLRFERTPPAVPVTAPTAPPPPAA